MAQLAVVGPLGESDLDDQLRPDPVRTLLPDPFGERGLALLDRAEPVTQFTQRTFVVARADLARVPQPGTLVLAEQQRTEAGTRSRGIGESAHHELLFVNTLELQPGRRTTVPVTSVGPLGDQSLPPALAGFPLETFPYRFTKRRQPE